MLFETRPVLQFRASTRNQFLPAEGTHSYPMTSLDDELTLLKLVACDATRAIFRWDLAARGLAWSENIGTLWPCLAGKNIATESAWLSLIHPDDRPAFLETKTGLLKNPGGFAFDYRLAPGNGEVYRVRQLGHARRTEDGNVQALGVLEQPQPSPKPVLSLPTSPLSAPMNEGLHVRPPYSYPEPFVERLNAAIAASTDDGRHGALILLHLSNLPMVVNSCGHHNTERMVGQLLEKLRRTMPEARDMERLSRDQFGIVLPKADAQTAHRVATRLQQVVENYGDAATGGLVHLTSQLASVDFPETAKNAIDALDKAYIVLTGSGGGRYRTFEDVRPDLIQSRQNMGLANYLKRAIEENRLCLAFQPIIESRSGKVAHYEALLRVLGDDGKISSAGPLIPVAEAMGMIETVDTLVLHMVIEELRNAPDVTIAFNVSNLTTDNAHWLEMFHESVKPYPDETARMIVEITETAAQRDLRRTAYFVASVQSSGAMVALDDFGSGYTSLRQLKALSVDMVKIDGAFVRDLVDNAENRFFIKTLLGFTGSMGLKTVAEFVESGEIAKILLELGVEMMQGYYFGKPDTQVPWR